MNFKVGDKVVTFVNWELKSYYCDLPVKNKIYIVTGIVYDFLGNCGLQLKGMRTDSILKAYNAKEFRKVEPDFKSNEVSKELANKEVDRSKIKEQEVIEEKELIN